MLLITPVRVIELPAVTSLPRIRHATRLALAGCVLLLGCASAGSEEPDYEVPPRDEPVVVVIPVNVSNELEPRANVTIRLRSGDRTRILGSVTPGRERSFQVDSPELSAEYRLTATSPAFADAITSEPFSLSADSWVRWSIADNVLVVDQRVETAP